MSPHHQQLEEIYQLNLQGRNKIGRTSKDDEYVFYTNRFGNKTTCNGANNRTCKLTLIKLFMSPEQ